MLLLPGDELQIICKIDLSPFHSPEPLYSKIGRQRKTCEMIEVKNIKKMQKLNARNCALLERVEAIDSDLQQEQTF